jgi:hypothetical protein
MNKLHLLIKSFIFFLILTLTLQTLSAQDSTAIHKIKSFSEHFIAFSKSYPQEKVYLHFDNTSYYLGESVWFKAYTVSADRNSLSNLSKILYVELLNAEGYIIETKKLKLVNGECHGDFKLNATNYGGYYEVRAYTRYMLNFGVANYFSRIFPVYDAPKIQGEYTPFITDRPNSEGIPKIRPDELQKEQLNLSFFPEGGSLVQNVTSRVAFKTTTKNGDDAVVTGSVYNDKNEKVVEINTEYQGMGSFELTPDAGKYYAKVSSKGHDYRFNLPAALPTGYSLTIDNSSAEKIDVLIKKNVNTKSEPMGLSISCRGVLYAFEEINPDTENAIVFKCLKNLLPSGVAQITLYNASGEILGERLAFVNHQSQMKINVSQNKSTYQPFQKVNMDFQLTDAQNNPVESTFSLSVRDGSTSSNNPYSNNILSDLLLSSEIKGYVENPGLYFQADDNAHRMALDLLLLTQGWTRYSWKQMAGKTTFNIKQPVEKEMVIDGNIASVLLKNKKKNVDVSMILLSDSSSQQGKCRTDSVGNFNFALLDFKGDAKLILQSKVKNKRKDTIIMLNRQFSPDPQPYTATSLNITQHFKTIKDTLLNTEKDTTDEYTPKNQKNLSMSEREYLLKNVTVKEKSRPMKVSMKYDVVKEMDKMEDTGEWEPTDAYGFLSKTNKYVSYIPQPNGKIKLTYKGKNVIFVLRDSKAFATEIGDDSYNSGTDNSGNKDATNRGFKITMPLIDEIESISIVEDFNTMSRIQGGNMRDPSKNVIAVITPKKNYQPVPNGVRSTIFAGYSYTREFFSPQYSSYRTPNENDYRRTLYWNPDVKTDKKGHANIVFYNNNTCKAMNISAETVTENGVIGALNE